MDFFLESSFFQRLAYKANVNTGSALEGGGG